MKYFFDTEFIDTGDHKKPIYLLSIGIVCEDDRTYYAELDDADYELASPWVKSNVIDVFTGPSKGRIEVAKDIYNFVKDDKRCQFWSYFGAYDWVLFCGLFGKMSDIPSNIVHCPMELTQHAAYKNVSLTSMPPQETTKHHALNDAKWHRDMYNFIKKSNR